MTEETQNQGGDASGGQKMVPEADLLNLKQRSGYKIQKTEEERDAARTQAAEALKKASELEEALGQAETKASSLEEQLKGEAGREDLEKQLADERARADTLEAKITENLRSVLASRGVAAEKLEGLARKELELLSEVLPEVEGVAQFDRGGAASGGGIPKGSDAKIRAGLARLLEN